MIRSISMVGVCLFLFSQVHSQCLSGNCINGNGKYRFKSGAVYSGQFQQGRINGFGSFAYSNGDTYTGNWVRDRRHGEGILRKEGGKVYKGNFANNEFHGFGIIYYPDGATFETFWKEGQTIGVGKLKTSEGKIIQGKLTESGFVKLDDFMKDNIAAQNQSNSSTAQNTGGGDGANIDISVKQKPSTIQSSSGNNQKINAFSTAGSNDDVQIHALIVGVSRYVHFPTLKYTDDDAYRVYAFLKSPEGGAVPDKNIHMLIDEAASRERIMEGLKQVVQSADENDAVFIYISGHGLNGGYLPFDSDGYTGLIAYHELTDVLAETRSKQTLCVADACYSGSMLGEKSTLTESLAQFYKSMDHSQGGTAFLLSSKAEEYSLESQGLRQGIFSHYLIRGLGGDADVNRDKIITITELYSYIRSSVTKYTGGVQTPLLAGNFDRQMPIGLLR